MSYARLQAELLAHRDSREALLTAVLTHTTETLLMISTALPGANKTPPGSAHLFTWGLQQLHKGLGDCRELAGGEDLLGPYRILATTFDPRRVKAICLAIEAEVPAARLLDLDVYAADGLRIGRDLVGEPARRCLLCEQAAADCIRLRRHSMESLLSYVDGLLESYIE